MKPTRKEVVPNAPGENSILGDVAQPPQHPDHRSGVVYDESVRPVAAPLPSNDVAKSEDAFSNDIAELVAEAERTCDCRVDKTYRTCFKCRAATALQQQSEALSDYEGAEIHVLKFLEDVPGNSVVEKAMNAQQELERVKGALRVYSEPRLWAQGTRIGYVYQSPDDGKIARAALQPKGTK